MKGRNVYQQLPLRYWKINLKVLHKLYMFINANCNYKLRKCNFSIRKLWKELMKLMLEFWESVKRG